jgi:Tfp pilus assembly protein PilF
MGFLDNFFGKKDKKAENDLSVDDFFKKGTVYMEQQNFQQAIDFFKKCIEINSNYSNAYMGLCMGYAGMMDLESARKNYEILKNLDPDLAERLANSPTGAIILNGDIITL